VKDTFDLCLCHSGKVYADCCQPFHQGVNGGEISNHQAKAVLPLTAEALMRSRYCAFALASNYAENQTLVVSMQNYLLATWHESTRPESLDLDLTLKWTELKILGRKEGKKRHQKGWVRFNAHYQSSKTLQQGILSENSEFIKEAGRWFYVQGEILQE